ncbi:MAG: UxaA family hydrolase [Thermoplasmata archaeon]
MTKKFWVHDEADSVGVAVEDLRAGEPVEGAFMRGGRPIHVTPLSDVPLGHKVALKAIAQGEKVIEYAEVIGTATQAIGPGEHVHVHNIRSLRWGGVGPDGRGEAARIAAERKAPA